MYLRSWRIWCGIAVVCFPLSLSLTLSFTWSVSARPLGVGTPTAMTRWLSSRCDKVTRNGSAAKDMTLQQKQRWESLHKYYRPNIGCVLACYSISNETLATTYYSLVCNSLCTMGVFYAGLKWCGIAKGHGELSPVCVKAIANTQT